MYAYTVHSVLNHMGKTTTLKLCSVTFQLMYLILYIVDDMNDL